MAGTISTLLLTFLAPSRWPSWPCRSGPADYFALAVLAFVTVTALVGRSLVRGLLSLFLGLFIGLVGIDALTGQARFTFGVPQLYDGVDVVVVVVGAVRGRRGAVRRVAAARTAPTEVARRRAARSLA